MKTKKRAASPIAMGVPVALLAVVGCAPLPPVSQSVGVGLPAVRDLAACGVSVRFSGQPEKLPAEVTRALGDFFGAYSKWDISGWRFTKFRLVEYAVCACRDFPISLDEIKRGNADITNTSSIAGR